MKSIIALTGLGILSLLSEIFNFKKLLMPLVVIGLFACIGFAVYDWNTNIHYFNEMLVFDNPALGFTILICVVSLLWYWMSQSYFQAETHVTDHFAITLFALVGAIMMVSFGDLTILFLGIETLSISLYVLAGSKKNSLSSNEAALKYFLMGSFATGFLLFGIALIYGCTGGFHLSTIHQYVVSSNGNFPLMFYAGVLLMLIGMSFKVSAVPFHFWAPDVYTGSPTVITAFMATVVKTAAFAAFFRLFYECFAGVQGMWVNVLSIITVLTLLLGNVMALQQTNAKRILAFSSISHAGYMLMAIVSIMQGYVIHTNALFYYSAAYSIGSIISFTVLFNVSTATDSDSLDAFNGLHKRNSLMAFAMTIAVLSLAGIPPLAGFFAKYFIFFLSIQSGHIWLVTAAVIASLIGVYYYLRFIINMYGKSVDDLADVPFQKGHQLLLITCITLLIAISFAPGLIKIF
jgi:NADH-quinone oxidoreductase subunit N